MHMCKEAAETVTAGEWKCGTTGCHATLDNFSSAGRPHGMRTATTTFRSLPTH